MTRDEIINSTQAGGGGMYAVIPTVVMRDAALSMSAKMLYGIVTWKCNENAYCWASNRALGEELGLSAKRVSALLADLEAGGHIETEIVRDTETGQVLRRYIYPIVKSSRGLFPAPPPPKNEDTPPPENRDTPPLKNEDTSPHFRGDPPLRNEEKKYKEETKREKIPPIAPQGAAQAPVSKRQRAPKSVPTWQPDRFERFWAAYPRDEDRAKAVEEWDKLPQDAALMDKHGGNEEALLDEIARGLKRHLECEDWRANVGIPYAFRWLRGRRWTEKQKTIQTQGRPAEPPKPRSYRVEVVDGEEVTVFEPR